MSNQFYDYLANKIEIFFATIDAGSKFYIQFDEENQIKGLYEALYRLNSKEEFIYKNDKGGPYKTFLIKGEVDVVIAATINGVQPNYFVNLRNGISEQSDLWKGKSILLISCDMLDSVNDGGSNLQKKGAILHVDNLTEHLNEEIESSKLSPENKAVLSYHIEQKKKESLLNTNIWDYEQVLAVISTGEIEKERYKDFGLFYDVQLGHFNNIAMKNRLDENRKLFEVVKSAHQYEDTTSKLEKYFDESGIKKLKKMGWEEELFGSIKNSHDALMNDKNKRLNYSPNLDSKTDIYDLRYWEKPTSESAAGLRTRHIIVFNPQKNEDIELTFKFDEKINKNEIQDSNVSTMASNKSLIMKISHEIGTTTIGQVRYKHKQMTHSTFIFNIAVVECEEIDLVGIKTVYEISNKKGEKGIRLKRYDDEVFFGRISGERIVEMVEVPNQTINVDSLINSVRVQGEQSAWLNDQLYFVIKMNDSSIPFIINETGEKIVPIEALRMWKLLRENAEDFIYDAQTGCVQQGTRIFSTENVARQFYKFEKQIIDEQIMFGIIDGPKMIKADISIPEELQNSHNELIKYYDDNELIPSCSYMNEVLKSLIENYIKSYSNAIQNLVENRVQSSQVENLSKLGWIYNEDRKYMTPLHPLILAYQLECFKKMEAEVIEQYILERFNLNNLLPFVYMKDDIIYKPISQKNIVQWGIYEEAKNVSVGETNNYLAQIVNEKMNQFFNHFRFLFLEKSKAPMVINLIDISNDEEVVKGILDFMLNLIKRRNVEELFDIEVHIYNQNNIFSEFELLSTINDAIEFESRYGLKLDEFEIDPEDILRILSNHLQYYKYGTSQNYQKAHISFFKMLTSEKYSFYDVNEMDSGISLDGLISALPAVNTDMDYRCGFGIQNSLVYDNILVNTAVLVNELAANRINEGSNPYKKKKTVVSRTTQIDRNQIEGVYQVSNWVTFVDPNVGFDFFKDSLDSVLIIHYSDQYSNSNKLDAITVTSKISQYQRVVKDFIQSKDISINDESIKNAIKSFNSLNGEWLLRMIGNKGEMPKEKLSIITAVKIASGILDHPNIQWIPVSMEEILRVAGAVKLNRSNGIFSAKNLKSEGKHSDDILMIGLENLENKLIVHFYPIEVKIGWNYSSKIKEGIKQVKATAMLLKNELGKCDDNQKFKRLFYRNFFVQIILSSAEKMLMHDIINPDIYKEITKWKPYLMNDEYTIGYHLQSLIGEGAVISFKKEECFRSINMQENIMMIQMTEDDGYQGVIEIKAKVIENVQNGYYEFPIDMLLSQSYQNEIKSGERNESEINRDSDSIITTGGKNDDLESIRVLIGTAEGSLHKVYWEYGHPSLPNRHILISGKSGQGKSYFIQCMLKEIADKGITSLIFDYTNGFKTGQLELEFKEGLGEKLEQILVAKDKFPINPFKRNRKELDENIFVDEENVDIAERIKGVIASVYKTLGIQQQNSIYEAVVSGLNDNDELMNLNILLKELEKDGSSYAKTASSTIKPLIDKNPFGDSTNFNWDKMLKQDGKVYIIQLAGYIREVQLIITEFILWDLWNYKLQNGNKDLPIPVVLDEAQNLDHSEKSPSAKILTEGRKFGWSGWYATQFLKGQLKNDEVLRLQNSGQKIFFTPPDSEIPTIASTIATDPKERKNIEEILKRLKKGQCLSVGPMRSNTGELLYSEPVIVNIDSLESRNQ